MSEGGSLGGQVTLCSLPGRPELPCRSPAAAFSALPAAGQRSGEPFFVPLQILRLLRDGGFPPPRVTTWAREADQSRLAPGTTVPHTRPPCNSRKWILSLSCFFFSGTVSCLHKGSSKPDIQHDSQRWTQRYQVEVGGLCRDAREPGCDAGKQSFHCSCRGSTTETPR